MSKAEQATGVITFSFAGITAALTAAQAAQWGEVLMGMGPILLILFLIWRMRKLDAQLKDCQENHQKVTNQMIMAYMAMKDPALASKLPPMEQFISGEFDPKECMKEVCDIT